MNTTISAIVQIATAIIGVAILAVLVSKNANTEGVIKAGAGGFTQALQAAISPISGNYQQTYGFSPSF